MPTKPGFAFTWATSPLYLTGPDTGTPTRVVGTPIPDGSIPGQDIFAQHINYMVGLSGDWLTDWVELGTFNPDEDAHIIETDADGQANIARVNIPGHTSGASLSVENSNGNFAQTILQTSALAGLRVTQQGAGPAIEALNLGTGPGLVATGGTGVGASTGVEANGGSLGGYGLEAVGQAAWAGVRAEGVVAEAVIADGGTGAPAIVCNGVVSSPFRAGLHLRPQSPASSFADGDVLKTPGIASTSRGALTVYDNAGAPAAGNAVGAGGVQTMWSSSEGIGYALAEALANNTDTIGSFVQALGYTLDSSDPQTPPGDYILRWECEVLANGTLGGIQTVPIQVTVGAGPPIVVATDHHYQSSIGAGYKTLSGFVPVTLGGGLVPISLDFRTTSAPLMVANIRNVRFFLMGSFELF